MQNLIKDLGQALRGLRNSPAFAVTAIVTLALGIGASTAIFSVVNAVLLRPLPYQKPGQLALVWVDLRARNVTDYPFSPGDFKDLVDRGTAFSGVASVGTGRQAINDDVSRPEVARIAFTTSNIFTVLGIQPAFGRTFIEADGVPAPPQQQSAAPGATPQVTQQQAPPLPGIVVLSHGFWLRRYGGDSAVIGKTINFGQNNPAQIVGVLKPDAEIIFPPKANLERTPDVWVAMRLNFEGASRINHSMRVVARLKEGATFQQAQRQVDQLATDLRGLVPIKNTAGMYFRVEPMLDDVVKTVQRPLWLLFGAVGFVLLIACANVANLLLVRASARERELAVRSALGGSRWVLVRQMLSESLALALIGGGLGLLAAQAGIDLMAAVAPRNLPRLDGVKIDFWVFLFCIVASVLSAVVFGLVPALRASRPNVSDVLRGGRAASQFGGKALRDSVVVAEVALSFVLLVGTGLMLRSFVAVVRTDPGFDPNGVLTFQVSNPRPRSREEGLAFRSALRTRIEAIPGVQSVTASQRIPLDITPGSGRWVTNARKDDETAYRQTEFFFVDYTYFKLMKTRFIAGRDFTEADVPVFNPPPGLTGPQLDAAFASWDQIPKMVIVDDQLAKAAYPGESPIGKLIWSRTGGTVNVPYQIVGVVQHQRHTQLVAPEREMMFFPNTVVSGRWMVRTNREVPGLLPQVRQALTEVDPLVPIAEVRPLAEFVDRGMAATRFAFVMLGLFAAIAAVLAGVGLYGVLSSAVRQRTAEIGVRMAFGAPSGSIFSLVIGQGMRLSALGVVIGAVAAFLMTGAMRSMLVGVKATDPVTFITIAALFIGIAALACWIPARRAAALDPNVALQHE